MWALAEALPVYQKQDSLFAKDLNTSLQHALMAAEELETHYPETDTIRGLIMPMWLPGGCASDQAAVLIMALSRYYSLHPYDQVLNLIQRQAEGILLMQQGDGDTFPYGAFLSWQNLWHAYGNSQSDALLNAHQITNAEHYKSSALLEIETFYPYLQKEGYLNKFWIESEGDSISLIKREYFEQISYGIRPMVFACLSAYKITGENIYARQAGDIACWLLGKNVTGKNIYVPESGRCYDGIDSTTEINMNSGAESTIEALLTILAVEQNPISKGIFHDYFHRTKGDR
jgi:hypothetical protein